MDCDSIAKEELRRLENIQLLLEALVELIGGEDALPVLK